MANNLDLIMFLMLIVAILSGFPVAFSIAGVAVLCAFIGSLLGVMDLGLLGASGQRIFGLLTNNVLIAIPLFVLMGSILEKSRIAEELLQSMGQAFGSFKGGLGISVVIVGALLAASTGIVGATVVAMGMIALPAMLRANYNRSIAAGTVCTAGTLGQIIPPSTLLIILSDVMSNGFQQAQYEQGKFAVETLSVGQIFAAALVPGLLLVALYIAYLIFIGLIRPQHLPALPSNDSQKIWHQTLNAVLAPVALIIAVLGSILTGVATPTEAASIGAAGAVFLAAIRKNIGGKFLKIGVLALILLVIGSMFYPIRLQRSDLTSSDLAIGFIYVVLALLGGYAFLSAILGLIRDKTMQTALMSTTTMTAMIFATILAAGMFSLVFISLGGEERVADILNNMPGGPFGALAFSMLVIFVLGFFLDFVEIAVIVLPLIVPGLILLGHDPIWLTVLIAINLQTSFLTPPFGFSLFYLRAVAPAEVSTMDIYRGVAPYVGLQIIGIGLIWFWPHIATALPALLF